MVVAVTKKGEEQVEQARLTSYGPLGAWTTFPRHTWSISGTSSSSTGHWPSAQRHHQSTTMTPRLSLEQSLEADRTIGT
jgi:hypothetical protein